MARPFDTPLGLKSLPVDPPLPAKGWMYFNSTTNRVRYYNGSVWVEPDITNSVTIDTAQTITGQKTFASGSPVVVSRAGQNLDLLRFNNSTSGMSFFLRTGTSGVGGVEYVNNAYNAVVASLSDAGTWWSGGTVTGQTGVYDGAARVYSPNNAPPYPVTQVAGRGGSVALTASDIASGTFPGVNAYSGNGFRQTLTPGTGAASWRGIRFDSATNAGSDIGFMIWQDSSVNIEGGGSATGENGRFTIGVGNDSSSAAVNDELWFQGAARTVHNVGTVDAELQTILGAGSYPQAKTAGTNIYEWRLNNAPVVSISLAGYLFEGANRVYSAGNAPPYPVASVAGRGGAVALTAADIAAGTFAGTYAVSGQFSSGDYLFAGNGTTAGRVRVGDVYGNAGLYTTAQMRFDAANNDFVWSSGNVERMRLYAAGQLQVSSVSSGSALVVQSATAGRGAEITLFDQTASQATPYKSIRSLSGTLQVVNSAYNAAILTLSDAGLLSTTGGMNSTTLAASGLASLSSAVFGGGVSFSGITVGDVLNTAVAVGGNAVGNVPNYGIQGFTYQDAGYNGTNLGLSGYAGMSFFTGATQRMRIDYGGTVRVYSNLAIDGAAGTLREFSLSTAGLKRWSLRANSVAESGAGAGSDLVLRSYDDTGTVLATIPLSIARATGAVTLGGALTAAGPVIASGTSNFYQTGSTAQLRATQLSLGSSSSPSYDRAAMWVYLDGAADTVNSPRIGFHLSGVVASQIGMDRAGTIRTYDNPGTGYATFAAGSIYANGSLFENGTRVYSANNPPPYPVTQVAGRGGAVALTAADIGAGVFPAGNITVSGDLALTGQYRVAPGNKFAFVYSTLNDLGLMFNDTAGEYQFTATGAVPVFAINPNNSESRAAGLFRAQASAVVTGTLTGTAIDRMLYGIRSQNGITGGGVISFDTSNNLLWTSRFIVIGQGNGASSSANGYFDITVPPAGTAITVDGGAGARNWTSAGINLGVWEALWYKLPIGASQGIGPTNFLLTAYTGALTPPGSDYVLLAARNGDDTVVRVVTGKTLLAGQSVNSTTTSVQTLPIAFSIAPSAPGGIIAPGFIAPIPMVLTSAYARQISGSGFTYQIAITPAGGSGTTYTATSPATAATSTLHDFSDVNISPGDLVQINIIGTTASAVNITINAITR